MGEPRYNMAGVRDYTGVGLEELIADINQLYTDTVALIPELHKFEEEVRNNSGKLDDADDILGVIQYHISLFEDYAKDLHRLVDELPQRVEDSHIRIIENIHKNATFHLGGMILEFKKDHVIRHLKDEGLRPLLDKIYSSIRQHILEVRVIYALKDQLATFIKTRIITEHVTTPGNEIIEASTLKKIPPLDVPAGTKWKDISIMFIGAEEIGVTVGRKFLGVYDFQRCGFCDLRKKVPNEQWKILECFAAEKGEITAADYEIFKRQKAKNLKKHISLLRGKLRELFNIPEYPIRAYSPETKSWKAKFLIVSRSSSDFEEPF